MLLFRIRTRNIETPSILTGSFKSWVNAASRETGRAAAKEACRASCLGPAVKGDAPWQFLREESIMKASGSLTRRDLLKRSAGAWVLGRKLKLDPVKEAFIGDEEANRMRSRPARQWSS